MWSTTPLQRKLLTHLGAFLSCPVLCAVSDLCRRHKWTAGRQPCSVTTAFQHQTGRINQVARSAVTAGEQSCRDSRYRTDRVPGDKSFNVPHCQTTELPAGTREGFLCCCPAVGYFLQRKKMENKTLPVQETSLPSERVER